MLSKKQQKRNKKYLDRWLQKISNMPKITKCDICHRLGLSDPECLSVEYCRRVGIKFKCGSCKFSQYENTLRCPTRGNVNCITVRPKGDV